MQTYEIHPVANMMPGLNDEEIKALTDSISENGQRMPILVYEGKIIDGRHRYWACMELGIEPIVSEVAAGSLNDTELVNLAISVNVHRRSLTASQRAALAASLLPFFEDQAKKRQGARTDITEKIPEGFGGEARDQAGRAFSVNGKYVSYAKSILDWNEVIFHDVLNGEMGLQDAARLMKKQMDDALPPEQADKPLKVPNPPQKWDADVKYEVYASGVLVGTYLFNSETLLWNAEHHVQE